MQESLKTLLELQKVDQDLYTLKQNKVDIPNQLETMNSEQIEAETRVNNQEEKVADFDRNRRQSERDLEVVQDQIKKYQGQLYSVKTNK